MSVQDSFEAVGELIGRSSATDWLRIDGERLRAFSWSTHTEAGAVDTPLPENNPLGSALVDGFYLLSLLLHFEFKDPAVVLGGAYGFNYGIEATRFVSPVFIDDEVRARRTIADVRAKSATRLRVTYDVALETKRTPDTPSMVARWLVLYVDGKSEQALG